MKKNVLLVLLLFSFTLSFGNKLTIVNLTQSTFNWNVATFPPGSWQNCSTPLTINPGTIIYNSPDDIPGLSSCSESTDIFGNIWGFCNPADIDVFSPSYVGGTTLEVPEGNECNDGVPFIIIWSENLQGDGVLLITNN